MKNNCLLFILFFVFQFSFSQSVIEKKITFKVFLDSIPIEKVNVVNERNQKATASNKYGILSINVSVGDVIQFSAVNLESKKVKISLEHIKSGEIIVKMKTKNNQLKEVVVKQNEVINSVSAGILQKPAKKYTPAERKLHEATSGSGLIPLNPIINWFTGRTAMLKKEIIVEKREKLLLRLDGYFKEEYYTNVLKIPSTYIKGFQYYLIEDADFTGALESKNKTMATFLIKGLATNYLQIISKKE